jgi:SAM-dependent methyltransferase
MIASPFLRRSFLTLILSLASTLAFAQDKPAAGDYQPEVGQSGKDVVWVPTPQSLVDKMLDIAKVTPADFVIDLGSGDGRTVITAAKRGARALGIEYNPDMVALSQRNAEKEGVTDKATFMKADLFESDFSRATVITMFLLPDINLKLRPKILGLKPGTRIVSNSFTMGEWQHDRSVNATESEGCQSYCTAYLWIVPANVDGAWKLPEGELTIKQSFQMITGTLKTAGKSTAIKGRMSGDHISFKAGDAEYRGRVGAEGIKGTVKARSGTGDWSATRTTRAAS